MARRCNDADSDCSGRAYQRKGFAWWLCRHHWGQMIEILRWAEGYQKKGTANRE